MNRGRGGHGTVVMCLAISDLQTSPNGQERGAARASKFPSRQTRFIENHGPRNGHGPGKDTLMKKSLWAFCRPRAAAG